MSRTASGITWPTTITNGEPIAFARCKAGRKSSIERGKAVSSPFSPVRAKWGTTACAASIVMAPRSIAIPSKPASRTRSKRSGTGRSATPGRRCSVAQSDW